VTLWQTGPYLKPITSPAFDPWHLGLVYCGALQKPEYVPGNMAAAIPGAFFNIHQFVSGAPPVAGRQLLNHDNFAPPSTDFTSSSFGQVTSVPPSENAENRTGQITLRIEF